MILSPYPNPPQYRSLNLDRLSSPGGVFFQWDRGLRAVGCERKDTGDKKDTPYPLRYIGKKISPFTGSWDNDMMCPVVREMFEIIEDFFLVYVWLPLLYDGFVGGEKVLKLFWIFSGWLLISPVLFCPYSE